MKRESHLTIGEVSECFGVPDWKIRRVVDSLDEEIPRIGLYRLVPRTLLGEIAIQLMREGWLVVRTSKGAR